MSRKLGLFVAVMLLTALAVPVFAQGAFEDVPMGHWAYNAVDTLAKANLIEGFPDGTFKGGQPMTRYEFAMIIARALQSGALRGPAGSAGPAGPAGPVGVGGGTGLTPEQQALLAKLQQEFLPELKRLRSDLDELEGRVRDLEGKPGPGKPKVTVSGDMSIRAGLYGTKLELGASEATGYPYAGIGGPHEQWNDWFVPSGWGEIAVPAPDGDGGWDAGLGTSVPVSDALKDSFKAPDFMTMRSRVNFNGDLSSDVKVGLTLLADTRGNLVAPYSELDDIHGGDDEILSSRTPNIYYSDGIMDSVRVDQAWMKYNLDLVRPMTITAGKLYWGFGRGLLANNSQFATKSARVDIALTGAAPGEGITWTSILGMLDREAFGGYTALQPRWPDPNATSGLEKNGGVDDYAVHAISLPLPFAKDWKLGGTMLGTGFGSERGWSVDLTGKVGGSIDLWGEFARLTRFPDGGDETGVPVDLDEEDTAWIVGAGWKNNDFSVAGQYGIVEPLYAIAGFDSSGYGRGWDPVGLGAILTVGGTPATNGYLNLPLSLLHPVEEFNPHYINWLDRPLFLDATNVAKGWEAAVTLKRLLGEKTPISLRYYDGKAYNEDYLGWLFTNDGTVTDKPSRWRDADAVWAVTLSHHFTDALTANLTYGQREVENVMSPNNPALTEGDVDDDPIKVLRLDLSVAF